MTSAWQHQKDIDDRDDYEMLWQRLLSEAMVKRRKEDSTPVTDEESKEMMENAKNEASKAIYGE